MRRRTLGLLAVVALVGVGLAGYAAGALAQYDYGDPSTTTTATATTTTPESGKGSGSKPKSYRSTLSTRAEVPKPVAPARAAGTFSGTVTAAGGKRTLRWTLTFRNLSGKAVAAHVHRGKPGVAGAVLTPLCGPCRTGQAGRVAISPGIADVLERGGAYVNVHTAKNQAGEIRGQVRLVSDDG